VTRSLVSLPVDRWPELDRQRWLAAQAPAGFLEPDKPASHWSPHRRVITEAAYGRYLAFLERDGALDPCCTPGQRATEPRLRAFVTGLQAQVAPASASMIVGALLRMLVVLEPERDWTFLSQVYRHLKRTAVPSRDKLSRMVPAADLFELGIRLMDTWANFRPQLVYKATQFRDGLLISILICCPVRLRNLTEIVIGRHLIFDGHAYRLEFAAAETKDRPALCRPRAARADGARRRLPPGPPPALAHLFTRRRPRRGWSVVARPARQTDDQPGNRAPDRAAHEAGVRQRDLPPPVQGHRRDGIDGHRPRRDRDRARPARPC
jgi:hypothetical protein